MSTGWRACPHCLVAFVPQPGSERRGHCPACGKDLTRASAPLPTRFEPGPAIASREFLAASHRRPFPYELVAALAALIIITVWYIALAQDGVPNSSGPVGHGLGVVGFLLMLSSETLYSIRKHIPRFTLGRMSTWLQVHVFTGIVGAYMVVLHAAWRFNGVAGLVTLLTVIIVASGFIGRYIYTALPRRVDGMEMAVGELEDQIALADDYLRALGVERLGKEVMALAAQAPPSGWRLVLGRPLIRWRYRRRLRRAMRRLGAVAPKEAAELERKLAERHRLLVQIRALPATRRLLALWHMFHVPLGIVLFTMALVHIAGALYYGTLMR